MVEHFSEKHSIDSFVFCWLFFQMTTIDFVYKLLPNFFIPSFVMAVMPVIASWLCILFDVKKCRYVHRDVVIFFVCVIGILLCSIFGNVFLQSVAFTSSFLVLITACIFLYTRKDIHHLFLHINVICMFSGMIVCVYALSFTGSNYLEWENSYMAIGYSLSLCSLILFECARINHKRIDSIMAMVFSAFILAFGNRGAFMVVLVYFGVRYTFLHENRFTTKKIILLLIGIALTLVMSSFYEQIILFVTVTLRNMGISSRSFEKLLTHSFVQSVGRNEIYEKAFEIIKNSPITIRGPGYLTLVYINEHYQHTNAHNILLELIVEYGCILGIAIFGIILKVVIRSVLLLRKNKILENSIAVCLLIQSMVQLSFSATFYSSNELWIGLVLTGILSRSANKSQAPIK